MIESIGFPDIPNREEEFSWMRFAPAIDQVFRVVEVYSGRLYRLIKMVNQPQDAEDILQETFIKAFRNMKSLMADPRYLPGYTGLPLTKH
jgi:hypothetical protein